jgi:tetratricopeptide (TPR) repeat protein
MSGAWALYEKSDYAAANVAYAAVLAYKPDHADALHLRGVVLYQLKDYEAALHWLLQARQHNPRDAAVCSNIGLVLRALKRYALALEAYDQALALKPDFVQAWANRGNLLRDMQQAAAAVESYQKALALQPVFAQALHGMGLALSDQKRYPESLVAYDAAIAHNPSYAIAFMDRGNALRELERTEDALASYEKAIALKPDYTQAWSNRGVVLKFLQRFDEAEQSYLRALQLQPDFVDAIVNYATLLKDMQRLPQAIALNQRAIALDADSSGAHLNLAICHLLTGDLQQGLPEYEWRWKTEQLRDGVRSFTQPLWLGDADLAGKTILLHAEQGLGDTLQFCRYAPMVAALGAKVVLEVQAPLVDLLKSLPGVDVLLAQGQPLPHFDVHCPLLSLPLAFKTRVESIPAMPRYLHSDAVRVRAWQQRLGQSIAPRVGVVWSGRPEHKNDHNRSMAFSEFAHCLQTGVQYHCLQKDIRSADQDALQARADMQVWGSELHSFADTAALVECMDAVIAVDTSVAHLAAALGKPVQLLLPFSPDWRWIVGRNDTPWYPSMRLLRQSQNRQWADVLQAIEPAIAPARAPQL